jgi:predicted  nucleic acid-binding Zn-ribbon protein
VSHPLLDLQAVETLADQLRHRRDHLPERVDLDAARLALKARRDQIASLQRQIDELEAAIAQSETDSHTIDVQRERLEKQLKTVFAPREAEALMHQIAGLNERRGLLDDGELDALEQQSMLADQITALAADEPALAAAVAAAEHNAGAELARIDAELTALAAQHEPLRAAVDETLLGRYDRLRTHHVVAAAALQGHRCLGCHLDLSAAELDEVRDAAKAGGVGDCPHCNRMLVV